jgi:L-ascorbate metabolism protein UlaG (beta-lactamase superfamily)
MQLIPMFAKIDFSVLPIGDNFTMGATDAASAAKMLKCNTVIGVHYDTFGYIKIDHEKSMDIFKKNGLALLLPAIGETMNL